MTGSGSNEFTRYLAKTFLGQGHTVQIICREYYPEKLDFIGQLWQWKADGSYDVSVQNTDYENICTLHQIPYGSVYPVYISGKKSSTVFKAFVDLTDDELDEFKRLNHKLLELIFSRVSIDILHANHLVMQPSLAIDACKAHDIPLVIYPHGSAIEYAVKKDGRYQVEARQAIQECRGLIIGNNEVRDRICRLFPDLADTVRQKTQIVGVGVDTQLFTPIKKQQRAKSIESFVEAQVPDSDKGKSPEILQQLYLDLGKNRYESIVTNGDAYVQNNLDTDIKQKLESIDLERPVIIFVGALTAGKGLQSLICALPLVYQQHPDTQLVIIGAGDFREKLEALIYALGHRDDQLLGHLTNSEKNSAKGGHDDTWQDVDTFLEKQDDSEKYYSLTSRLMKQVIFLGRFNHEQLSYIFPCADLAVFPSVIPEAYPLVLMESLANGVLPMVSYFSGFKDAVDELEQHLGGELVSRLKIPMEADIRIESMASNVIELLNILSSQDFSASLSSIARDNYDWTHRGKQMVDAYSKVMGKHDE